VCEGGSEDFGRELSWLTSSGLFKTSRCLHPVDPEELAFTS